jgi:hypothetical protein
MGKPLVAFIAMLVAGPAWADTMLTYAVNAPESISPTGKASGGRFKRRVLVGPGRVRVEDDGSIMILREDRHEIYVIRPSFPFYCRHGWPLDLKAELPGDLYQNLQAHPHDRGPAVVKTADLGGRKVGQWQASGTRIEVLDGPDSWTKTSVWTTSELPQVAYGLVSELQVALAPLANSRPATARAQALAKLPGVPVRIEEESKGEMSGETRMEEWLVAVEDRQAAEEDYLPPKGLKRGEYFLCFH